MARSFKGQTFEKGGVKVEVLEREFNTKDALSSFFRVTKEVLLSPKTFFLFMPKEVGFSGPVIYLGICFAIWGILRSLSLWDLSLLLFAIYTFFLSFISAGVLYLAATKLFGGKGTYEGTFRVVAYSSAVNLLSWIPYVGFIASLYGLWIKVLGLESVHGLSKIEACLTVLIGLGVFVLLSAPIGGFVFIWT